MTECPLHKACRLRRQVVATCEAGEYVATTHNGLVNNTEYPQVTLVRREAD